MRKFSRFQIVTRCALAASMVTNVPWGRVQAQSTPQTAATIDSQTIFVADLDARVAPKLAAEEAEFQSRLQQLKLSYERSRQEKRENELSAMVDERVLALEAKNRHSTPDALVAAITPPPATDAQARSFYESKKSQITQPYDAILPQIKKYLDNGAAETARRRYLDSLRSKYHAQILLEPRRETVAASGPSRGPAGAPVTVVEFSDFQCPFCGRLEPTLVRVLAKYPNETRLVYRNFPLTTLHPDAQRAALAGVCAQQQGKFWPLHDLMFAEQGTLSPPALEDKARRAGLDLPAFDTCLGSAVGRELVAADVKTGEALGIQGTPATFVNGRFISGAVSEAELSGLIEDELRRSKLPAPPQR